MAAIIFFCSTLFCGACLGAGVRKDSDNSGSVLSACCAEDLEPRFFSYMTALFSIARNQARSCPNNPNIPRCLHTLQIHTEEDPGIHERSATVVDGDTSHAVLPCAALTVLQGEGSAQAVIPCRVMHLHASFTSRFSLIGNLYPKGVPQAKWDASCFVL